MPFIYPSIYLSIYLSNYLSTYLSIYLSIYICSVHCHTLHQGFNSVLSELTVSCAGDKINLESFESVFITPSKFLATEVGIFNWLWNSLEIRRIQISITCFLVLLLSFCNKSLLWLVLIINFLLIYIFFLILLYFRLICI